MAEVEGILNGRPTVACVLEEVVVGISTKFARTTEMDQTTS